MAYKERVLSTGRVTPLAAPRTVQNFEYNIHRDSLEGQHLRLGLRGDRLIADGTSLASGCSGCTATRWTPSRRRRTSATVCPTGVHVLCTTMSSSSCAALLCPLLVVAHCHGSLTQSSALLVAPQPEIQWTTE